MRRSELAALCVALLPFCAATSAIAADAAKFTTPDVLPSWVAASYLKPTAESPIHPPLRAPDSGIASPSAGGLRAYFDPKTGRLSDGPPPNQPEYRLPSPVKRNFGLMWEERLPDGSGLTHLEGQMQMTSFGTLDASGQVKIECLPGAVERAPEGATKPATDAENDIAAPREREQRP
jgi:hypothetical protein